MRRPQKLFPPWTWDGWGGVCFLCFSEASPKGLFCWGSWGIRVGGTTVRRETSRRGRGGGRGGLGPLWGEGMYPDQVEIQVSGEDLGATTGKGQLGL